MLQEHDTIAAIATSMGNSGIHIIRISGLDSFDVISRVFKKGKKCIDFHPEKYDSHTIHYGFIYDGDMCIDEVLVSVFKSPNSFTSENTVEVNCHGGSYVVQRILELIINNGARLAMPGEFSKRAFLNGRIDLTQAEAVMNIINSKNEISLNASIKQIKGDVKNVISSIRNVILTHIANIEATLDDPEHYSFDDDFLNILGTDVNKIIEDINVICNNSKNGIIVSEGIKTVIVGKPNVGKSSLMNYILKDDKAIVTNIPGTTRDVIEYSVNLANVTLNLVDTAGIHDTSDMIEQLGIDRTKEYIENADLILCVFDMSDFSSEDDVKIYNSIADKNHLCIFNKCDLEKCDDSFYLDIINNDNSIMFSAKEKIGYDELVNQINNMFYNNVLDIENEIFITNVRHMELLNNAIHSLSCVIENIDAFATEDILTIDLLDAYNYLGEIIGETIDDDVVDKIFSDFCMGK